MADFSHALKNTFCCFEQKKTEDKRANKIFPFCLRKLNSTKKNSTQLQNGRQRETNERSFFSLATSSTESKATDTKKKRFLKIDFPAVSLCLLTLHTYLRKFSTWFQTLYECSENTKLKAWNTMNTMSENINVLKKKRKSKCLKQPFLISLLFIPIENQNKKKSLNQLKSFKTTKKKIKLNLSILS